MYIVLIYSTSIQISFEFVNVIYDTMSMEAQSKGMSTVNLITIDLKHCKVSLAPKKRKEEEVIVKPYSRLT